MSERESIKISGKKFPFPPSKGRWKFTSRPGGWVVAESFSGERKRLMLLEHRGSMTCSINGKLWYGEVIQNRPSGSSADPRASDSDLVAQFPGKVRKILVQEGSSVKEGDGLILVEAMKMEFAIKSPSDGKVTRILVKEGQQLSPGDRFLDLEASSREA